MAPQDAVDGRLGNRDAVIPLQIPDDADGAEVIGAPQVKHLLDNRNELQNAIEFRNPQDDAGAA